jgi:16S rRNA (guanine1207-N2)-methyltransferase
MKIWNSPAGTLKLKRYPFEGERSHQAWDSADEWILKRFPEHQSPVLITGEAFGVLGTAWSGVEVAASCDSSLSLTALERNRRLNPQTATGHLTVIPSDILAEAEGCFSKIFIRIPKSIALFEYYIENSIRMADENTEIWIGAMDKRWSRGAKKITERLLQVSEVFPFERHSRWISFKKMNAPAPAAKAQTEWKLDKYPLLFQSAPDVFSSSGLDEGTAAFLKAFPEQRIKDASVIADLGCGSGIFGISAAYLNPEATILFTDESYLAVRNAESNCKLNNLSGHAEFTVTDGLGNTEDESADLILCNPPFHFQNIQSREPAVFLFGEAERVLRPGGCIQIVGNSHLGYHKLLDEYFLHVHEVYRDSKFTVLQAEKR